MWSIAVSLIVLHVLLVHLADGQTFKAPQRSCLDYLRSGTKTNGYYSVVDQSGASLTVYCDFESEPGAAWTLVMSWSRKNKDLNAFKKIPFTDDVKVNEKTPNWIAYRQSKNAMNFLKSQSSHWRATCSFNSVKFDYRDYVRSSFNRFDITTFLGEDQCKLLEYIDIRGHVDYQTTAAFWQARNTYILHISPSSKCLFNPAGAVSSEDNFGFYSAINEKFRCTANSSSTTQYWFGGYI